MKVVILAGGYGTRLSEETKVKPKPMVEIGNRPILWHIMKIYSAYGLNDFVICCGYKGDVIKQYFADYFLNSSDITFDMKKNEIEVHRGALEEWRVTLVDTGEKSMTGGRIKHVRDYIEDDTFCLTYGDGVSDVNITELIACHKQQGGLATLTAVQSPGRFGAFTLDAERSQILDFREKPTQSTAWVNGGFFVLEPQVIDYIEGDSTIWEQEPMYKLSQEGKLVAYRHTSYWQNMDTLRDVEVLNERWRSGKAPWKIW
ncbi:MAG: glucose-1-phosphate cytidylyltransferase [Anaerolineae bacterium]|jgi:glucose-1-phosphate cytidylyltransferase|nr:glucose-1-phosphate cytidylyltransferase [Anaerolineae bacterium]MBT7192217.1 glucose-1-phosphate cytidylyltransferase [Anaerolineae bacterium]MBT7989636.1 glucose-1-phosphate cytidylyltransferase [Anaerolineae bacterium]